MFNVKCCICKEETNSPYTSIKHLGNGKAKVYSGHKRCLSLLETKLKLGDKVDYDLINVKG